MVYLKSAIGGILMVGATALILYVTLTLLLMIPVLRRGEGFDLPRWHVRSESPAFWIPAVIVFAAGFLWEFIEFQSDRTNRNPPLRCAQESVTLTTGPSRPLIPMGKIHVLPERVANQIAAGEVVERPASVVKELLENALDAGSTRIRIQVEAGGKKLIQITDNGCGMVRDDAMLAFERHATSKIKDTDDLLSISTLGFRGEALPSIASVARLHLETRAEEEAAGTVLEINGGKIIRVEEAGLPLGTSITIRDLFFNTPARKKFLRSESTELSHIASLVTHYALAHPEKHFELHSATNALLVAPPVAGHRERVYQVFGRETLDQLISLAAMQPLERVGLPQPPPWRRAADTSSTRRLILEVGGGRTVRSARSGHADRSVRATRFWRSAAARFRFKAGNSEAQS